jgi:hypothetical protein
MQQAFINILRYFTLESGQQPNLQQHYTPDQLVSFFKDRSEDYRLITLYYQDQNGNFEDQPRVKLVNSLDLMENLLVAADFQVDELGIQIVGDSSLQYSAELAEAWGDEPRELWPAPIQALAASGTKIKTLQDVVNDMNSAQAMYADITGYPTPPNCKQTADPSDPPAVQAAETTWPKNRTGIQLPEVGPIKSAQRSLFNMNQVLGVLQENVPGYVNGNPYPSHAGGLTILRDIMYELYFSTPSQYQSYTLSQDQEEYNHLKAAIDLSRMGVLRAIGQKLRQFKSGDPALLDMVKTLAYSSTHPETNQALNALFVANADQNVLWSAIQSVFSVLDAAEGNYTADQQAQLAAMSASQVQAQKAEWLAESNRMKQLGEYAVALGESHGLTASMLNAVSVAVGEFPAYLALNADGIAKVLHSQEASYFVRAYYETPADQTQQLTSLANSALSNPLLVRAAFNLLQAIDNDSVSQNSWTLFSNRNDALQNLSAYQPYRQYFDRFENDLIFFFTDQSTDPSAVLAADHMRLYLADLLQQGDIDQFLILAKDDPNKFYQLLQTLSHYIENGDLQNFFNLVRQGLSAPSQ